VRGKDKLCFEAESFSRLNILSLCTKKHLQKINMCMGASNSAATMEQIIHHSLRLSMAQPVLYTKRMNLLAYFLLVWL